jgi:hypothetical protein
MDLDRHRPCGLNVPRRGPLGPAGRRGRAAAVLSDPDAALEAFSESSGVVSGNFGAENADEAAYGAAGSNTNFGTLLLDDLAIGTQDRVGPSA